MPTGPGPTDLPDDTAPTDQQRTRRVYAEVISRVRLLTAHLPDIDVQAEPPEDLPLPATAGLTIRYTAHQQPISRRYTLSETLNGWTLRHDEPGDQDTVVAERRAPGLLAVEVLLHLTARSNAPEGE